jgi:hypothetical protein
LGIADNHRITIDINRHTERLVIGTSPNESRVDLRRSSRIQFGDKYGRPVRTGRTNALKNT